MRKPEKEPLEDVLARLEKLLAQSPDHDITHLPLLVTIAAIPRNEPQDFARIFRYFADTSPTFSSSDPVHLASLALRLRTTLFKAVPLVGVPRIINAQSALYDSVSSHAKGTEILAHLPTASTKPTKTTEEDSQAGWAFFKAIYERHAERIIERISQTSPDLAEMIVDDLYGANLSRTEVLTWQETVLIEFVGCGSLDCPQQVKGHYYGSKNLGVKKHDVKLAIEVLRAIGQWRGEPLNEERIPFIADIDKWPQ